MQALHAIEIVRKPRVLEAENMLNVCTATEVAASLRLVAH